MSALRKAWRNFGPLASILALIVAVGFLPPDTSLQEVRRAGLLRACVPETYPPLITGDPNRPGIDLEILRAIAEKLDVKLAVNRIGAMGRDFNPRNWRLTRANCAVIAGGVVDSAVTRSFLDISDSYAETGWALIGPAPLNGVLEGRRVGVVVMMSGLDRIALSSRLQAEGAGARIFRSPDDLAEALAAGEVDLGVTEWLLAHQIAAQTGLEVRMMGGGLPRFNLTFGLWRGDLTLKRAINRAFADLRAEGEIDVILDRYLGEG